MENLSGTNSSLFYFITLLLLFMNAFSVYSYNSISYNETEPGLKINKLIPFRDKLSIIHMIKPINESCIEPRIDLRILYPNGTIGVANVDYPIPEYNFCYGADERFYWFDIYQSLPDSLLVLYINSTDLASASYYGLLVTRTGNFISNTYIAPASIINGSIYANGFLTTHHSEEYGFIFSNYETETVVMWSYFSKPDKGKFDLINNGKYYLQNPMDNYYVFPGNDGSYGFVTMNSTGLKTKPNNFINPSEFTSKVYVSFIKPIMNVIDGPFLIYQSAIPYFNVDFLCDAAYTSTGNNCVLTLKRVEPEKKVETHFIKISFQNTGSVFGVSKFTNKEFNDVDLAKIRFHYLFYGGYLFLLSKNIKDSNYKTIQGIIFDNDGNYNGTLDFPPGLKFPNYFTVVTYRNGTILLISQEKEFTWNVLSTLLPKFIPNDHGYDNPNIKFTYPLINSNISLSTTNINITYHLPVALSTNNISIYQYNNDENLSILRQSVPGSSPFFSFSPDNTTLNIKVLESTFNQPNSIYYVVVNYNSIKNLKSNQPLMGVEKNRWKFNTNNNQDIFADSAVGQFSLTLEGTGYFKNLSLYDQTEFLSRLRIDLAKSIPVDINRLDNIKCCEYDKSQRSKILLSLPIKSTTNPNERNVDRVMKDLDILIKSKEITPISWFSTTNHLEASFGFRRTKNFLDDYQFYLVGIIIGIIILCLFYVYAMKRYPMGKNIVIFKFSLIILGFILNISFILNNGKNVPQLFIPSIIFCVIPITINSVTSIIIILREITKNKYFYEWFKNNTNLAALLTILAGANLEVLNILSSQVAGIMSFSAPISKKTQSCIFWASLVGFFIGDIPRFIIQVFYKKLIVNYDIIPFLTLLTSSIILANNIISRIYHAIVHLRMKRRMSIMALRVGRKMTFVSNIDDGGSLTDPQTAKMYYRHSM